MTDRCPPSGKPDSTPLWLITPPPKRRRKIGRLKEPMLQAVFAVFKQYRELLPITVRQLHYRLLIRHVITNARRRTLYRNTKACYNDLCDLTGRARLEGRLPWAWLHDPTRDWTPNYVRPDRDAFVRDELTVFLEGYRRNLLQSQRVHIEVVCEKTTAVDIIAAAVRQFGLPVGRGGGQASTDFIHRVAERFRASGKCAGVLLVAGDSDKSGDDICDNWVRGLRDEHGLGDWLSAYKVAVTPDQVRQYGLAGWQRDGQTAYELEAFEPDVLQAVVRDAVTSVIDVDLFERERRKWRRELRELEQMRADAAGWFKRTRRL
jgi:hypothetical protein